MTSVQNAHQLSHGLALVCWQGTFQSTHANNAFWLPGMTHWQDGILLTLCPCMNRGQFKALCMVPGHLLRALAPLSLLRYLQPSPEKSPHSQNLLVCFQVELENERALLPLVLS